ncbi:MAG: glycosyltransferase family 2 protein [Bacilli bacterium]|nr:glycosyltransferase family 2 protein [Bacilli bacterium]
MDKISIIVPCFNEEKVLPLFYKEINMVIKHLEKVEFEIIFVDDGSRDRTLEIIKDYSSKNSKFRYISFSRNFGKEAAMYAGLKESIGDYVAIMDADLQDPPKLLIEMYDIVSNSDYDCVATRRVTRSGEPPIRSFFARLFYKLINKISKADIVDGARDFRLMTRQMADSVLSIQEYNRFSKGIFGWIGFKTKWLEYENIERAAGETKWSFWKLFLYSIEGIVAFSTFPLVLPFIFSFIFFVLFLVFLIWGLLISSGTFIVSSFVLISTCVILALLGVMSLYLSKTYTEIKNRPIYIIREESKRRGNKK